MKALIFILLCSISLTANAYVGLGGGAAVAGSNISYAGTLKGGVSLSKWVVGGGVSAYQMKFRSNITITNGLGDAVNKDGVFGNPLVTVFAFGVRKISFPTGFLYWGASGGYSFGSVSGEYKTAFNTASGPVAGAILGINKKVGKIGLFAEVTPNFHFLAIKGDVIKETHVKTAVPLLVGVSFSL